MSATHDIQNAVVKAVIEWDKSISGWQITLTRLDGSQSTWAELTMQEATDAIARLMET